MVRQDEATIPDRTHFFALAAKIMRNILADFARSRHRQAGRRAKCSSIRTWSSPPRAHPISWRSTRLPQSPRSRPPSTSIGRGRLGQVRNKTLERTITLACPKANHRFLPQLSTDILVLSQNLNKERLPRDAPNI